MLVGIKSELGAHSMPQNDLCYVLRLRNLNLLEQDWLELRTCHAVTLENDRLLTARGCSQNL